jgi:DNA-binding transcriptional ArsR family regulator
VHIALEASRLADRELVRAFENGSNLGARTVAELAAALRVPRSRLSNHLACLKWCRFVAARREGRYVRYRVADPRVARTIAAVDDLSRGRCGYLARCRRIGPDWI